jgi:hypothetical protein
VNPGYRSTTLNFETGVGVTPVSESDPFSLTIEQAMDTVSLGGTSASNITFYLITAQSAPFEVDPFSGIQGKRPVHLTVLLDSKKKGC